MSAYIYIYIYIYAVCVCVCVCVLSFMLYYENPEVSLMNVESEINNLAQGSLMTSLTFVVFTGWLAVVNGRIKDATNDMTIMWRAFIKRIHL